MNVMNLRGLAAVLLLVGATAFAAEPAAGIKVPANQRFVLPNGLTIVLVPKKDVPLIAFSGFVRGGALSDPADKPGVASLVAGLLDRGAGKRSAFEFAEAVEGVGGSFSAAAGSESISFNGQFLARDRALMIELLGDALMRPHLEAAEFTTIRDREIEFIKAAKDSDPSQIISIYGRAWLFGKNPLGRPQGGSERSLAAITHADVMALSRRQFRRRPRHPRVRRRSRCEVDEAGAEQGLRGLGQVQSQRARAQGCAARQRPARVAGRCAGLGADLFLAGQCGRGQALQRTPGARPGEHAVRRAIHLHSEHRAAHQVRALVRRRFDLPARQRAGSLPDPLLHADGDHRAGAGSHAGDSRAPEARSAARRDAGIGACLRARPVPAAVRDRGALGRHARGPGVLRARQGVHRRRIRRRWRKWMRPKRPR